MGGWTLDFSGKVKSALQTRGDPMKITCKSLLKTLIFAYSLRFWSVSWNF